MIYICQSGQSDPRVLGAITIISLIGVIVGIGDYNDKRRKDEERRREAQHLLLQFQGERAALAHNIGASIEEHRVNREQIIDDLGKLGVIERSMEARLAETDELTAHNYANLNRLQNDILNHERGLVLLRSHLADISVNIHDGKSNVTPEDIEYCKHQVKELEKASCILRLERSRLEEIVQRLRLFRQRVQNELKALAEDQQTLKMLEESAAKRMEESGRRLKMLDEVNRQLRRELEALRNPK